MLDLVPGEEEEKLVGIVGKFFGVGPGDEKLLDLGGRGGGFFPKNAKVYRDGTPAEDLEAAAGDDFLGNAADVGLGVVIRSGQEKGAHGEVVVRVEALTELFHFAPEKLGWDLREDAGPVAGFGIGVEGAPVGELADAADRPFQDGVGLAALNVGHETDAAGVVLLGGMVEALGRGKPVI